VRSGALPIVPPEADFASSSGTTDAAWRDEASASRVQYVAAVHRLEWLARSFGFAVIVVAIATWIQVDLIVHESEWDAGLAAAALLVPLPLLARRRAALVAPLLVLGGAALLAGRDPDVTYDVASPFFGVLLTVFVLAQHPDRRLGALGLGAALVTMAYVVARFPDETAGDFVWIGAFMTAVWVTGFVVSERSREAAAARERLRRLEAEREEQARRAVQEERQRIARELHDVVAHSVSEMTVQAGGVRRLLHDDQEREREALKTIEETGRQALAEMRRMLGILRSADEHLEAPRAPQPGMGSLASLIGEVRAGGVPVEYRVKGEPVALAPGIDVSAYRIVQEALARALTSARVEVRWGHDALELEVSGDGTAGGARNGGGEGFVGLRERVALYGGKLDGGPRLGGGYVVRARLPVREEAAG
jgi:signal transduction histidine kinase